MRQAFCGCGVGVEGIVSMSSLVVFSKILLKARFIARETNVNVQSSSS